MGMYRTVRRVAVASATVFALTLTGCSQLFPDDGLASGTLSEITVGSPAVPEGRLLAEIYGQALAAYSYDVTYNYGAGNRASYLVSMQNGAIDLIPEYSLSLLTHLSPSALERSKVDVVYAVEGDLADVGLYVLAPAEAVNSRAFVVTREFAEENDVSSIAELGAISSTLTIGGTKAFEKSDTGRAVLKKMYGIAGWRLNDLDSDAPEVAVESLIAGESDVIVLPAASQLIVPNDLVVLSDPSLLFRVNNVIPVVRSEIDTRPIIRIVDAVSEALTTEALRDLITRHANERAPGDAEIAHDWLVRNKLIEG